MAARTQKAAGYEVLCTHGWHVPGFLVVSSISRLHELFALFVATYHCFPFCRPCPPDARHGFVGSRVCKTYEEAFALFQEAMAIEPESEMMLCVPMDPFCSAVWMPGMLSIGPGNDGSTGGHQSFAMLTANVVPTYLSILATKAKIKATQAPYIEAVVTGLADEDIWYTQLRGGPKDDCPVRPDYIPFDVVVTAIITPAGEDEETWKKRCEALKDLPKGTVVNHSDGGTMASHYAAHAKGNSIPVLCTFKPELGQKLEKNWDLLPINPYSVRAGIAAGSLLNLSPKNARLACYAILTGTHNAACMTMDDGFFLGLAAILMARVGIAASQGESRHAREKGIARNAVYDRSFEQSVFTNRMDLPAMMELFTKHKWSPSYGGRKWKSCTAAVKALDTAIQTAMRLPTEASTSRLITALHDAVNQAHNTGMFLDKFISKDMMDRAAAGDPRIWISATPMMFAAKSIPRVELSEVIAKWKRAKALPVAKVTKTKRDMYAPPQMASSTGPSTPKTIVAVQAQVKGQSLHIQYRTNVQIGAGENYGKFDVNVIPQSIESVKSCPASTSWAMTSTVYYTLDAVQDLEYENQWFLMAHNDVIVNYDGKPVKVYV